MGRHGKNNYHKRLILLPLWERKIAVLLYQVKIAICGVISGKITVG
jgi:hypothetical protein